MTKVSINILIFIVINVNLFCQSVVISEYYNSNIIRNEWTELLVIEDNLNLAGYTLRDNSSSSGVPDKWQGGVRFRNSQLWNNIRAGTIIVINHRRNTNYNIDVDKSDGYIEIDAENTEYFEKRCFDCDTATDWVFKALSIAQNSEIIQLLDAEDNHVHALAHIPNAPSGDYLSLPNPKVCRNGSMLNNSSLRIVPGINLSAYNSGFGNTENDVSILFISKGKPNNSTISQNENQLLWRKIREPVWYSPSLMVEIYPEQNYLEWNSIVDPFQEDNFSGYLLIRAPLESINKIEEPIDGKIYLAGDSIGSSLVVAVIENSNMLNFYDRLFHPCGSSVVYRVFAFRFGKDNLGEDNNPLFARGRAYNETNFAQVIVIKNYPEKIKFSINRWTICNGESYDLSFDYSENYKEIKWFRNDIQIVNESKKNIKIKDEGYYYCKLTSDYGCETISDTFHLMVKPLPDRRIFIENSVINKDSVIYKCYGDNLELSVMNNTQIDWFFNDSLIKSGKDTSIITNEDGIYFAKIINQQGCSISTAKINLKSVKDSLVIIPNKLDFKLYNNETYLDCPIRIKNVTKNEIEIVGVSSPNGFKVITSLPIKIEAEKETNLIVRFEANRETEIEGHIKFCTSCDYSDSIYVRGLKKDSGLYSSKDTVDFGVLITCLVRGLYTVFQIHNPTDETATLYKPFIEKPFGSTDTLYPFLLRGKKSVDIAVNFVPEDTGYYSFRLSIPYKLSNVADTIDVVLIGASHLPDFEFIPESIEFNTVLDCDSTMDTVITLKNNSKYKIYPRYLKQNPNISVSSLPLELLPRESYQIKIRVNNIFETDTVINLEFYIDPCEITKEIQLKVKKQNVSINFEKDTLDFGNVIYCGGQFLHKRTLKLSISNYDSTKKYVVKKVDTAGWFKSNLFSGKELIKDNEIDVFFNPDFDGYFDGYIRIVIEPCNIVKYLYLRGRRVTPLINISENKLDFGSVQNNAMTFRKIQIKNQGNIEIKIEKIENLKLPFELYKLSSKLPAIIEPDSTFEIEFSYNPQNSAYDTNEITIVFSEPCLQSREILLKGDSFAGDTVNFKIIIRNLKAKVGENLEIPINLVLPNNFQIQSFKLEGIHFDLGFNPTLFLPNGVRVGDSFEKNEIKEILFKEEIAGKARIFIYLENFKNIKSGVLAYLNGKVLGGNALKTRLKPENINFNSNSLVEVQIEEGELEVEGKCNPEDRLIDLSNETAFEILELNNNKVRFILNVISDQSSKLVIFDNLGKQARILFDGEKKTGKYELELNLELLPNGIYYAVFSNGNILKTLSFPVIK